MKVLKVSLISATTFLMISAAFAQNAEPAKPDAAAVQQSSKADGARGPGKLDKNKDGAIELDEFENMDQLKAADTNGDGTLSQDELQAMVLKRIAARQAERLSRRLDADGDGKVTLAEVQQEKAKRFALLDRNNDGKIEKSEIRHHGKNAGKKHHGRHHHGHKTHGHKTHGKNHHRQNGGEKPIKS